MTTEPTDWQRIAYESARPTPDGGLSEESGAALEERVAADENDVDARVRLVGFYFLRFAPENHRRRAEHLAWLAEHRPDIGLGGYGYIEEEHLRHLSAPVRPRRPARPRSSLVPGEPERATR